MLFYYCITTLQTELHKSTLGFVWLRLRTVLNPWFLFSSGYLKAKQYMEEENYDKIISECTKEIESKGRYTAEALLLRATFYLLIGNATAAQPDLDKVINMQDANVKVMRKSEDKILIFTKQYSLKINDFEYSSSREICPLQIFEHPAS